MFIFSRMSLKKLMEVVIDNPFPEAAVWLELKTYLLVVDLAIMQEWRMGKQLAGVQVLRQAARIALARVVAASSWADCQYCIAACTCSVCGGTGSLLMPENELAAIVGEAWPQWRARIDCIEQMLKLVKSGEGAR